MRANIGLVALLVATLPLVAEQNVSEPEALAEEADVVSLEESRVMESEVASAQEEGVAEVIIQEKPEMVAVEERALPLEPDGTLYYYAGHPVRRTLAMQVVVTDAQGATAVSMTMTAKGVLTPINLKANKLKLDLEELAVRLESFSEDAGVVEIDTEASAFASPLVWWRSRNVRNAISSPLALTVDEQGVACLEGEQPDFIRLTVGLLVPRYERVFAQQWLTEDSTEFMEIKGGSLLGDGLMFAVTELDEHVVTATFAETGKGLKECRGTEGSISWNPEDALLFELKETGDYYLEQLEDSVEVVEAELSIYLTSELAA